MGQETTGGGVLVGRLEQKTQFFSFNEMREKVQPLIDREAAIRLRAVDGLSHYATKGFIPYLKSAIPWIKEVWRKPALH